VTPVYRVARALARVLLPLQMRLTVSGADHCPRTGPLVIVGNHLGLVDPLPIGLRVPRQVHFVAKSDLFEWPILGGLSRWCGVVPVHRGASDREAIRTLADLLARGQCVMLMPEGTYPKAPLPPAMLRAKTGAAFLALRAGATVLPVGITGTERVWSPSRGWRLWHRPRVTVTFGTPYMPEPPAGLSAKTTYQVVADDMGRRIAALLPPAYRGYYAGAVAAPAGIHPHAPRAEERPRDSQ
jgi:1-acyl-sn-glycerol-3-phosphate acyltransferase